MNQEEPRDTSIEDAARESRADDYYSERHSDFIRAVIDPDVSRLQSSFFPQCHRLTPVSWVAMEFMVEDEECQTMGTILSILRDLVADPKNPTLETRAHQVIGSLAARYAELETKLAVGDGLFDAPELPEPSPYLD